MVDPGRPVQAPPRLNALQRAWLRELGIERVWGRQPAAAAPIAAPLASAPAEAALPHAAAVQAPAGPQGRAQAPLAAQSQAVVPAGAPDAVLVPKAAPAAAKPGVAHTPRPASAAAGGQAARAAVPDVELLDLDALREQVLACTACGLCNGRRQAVFGTGAQPARWMVVGEAPGEQEDRQGLPFVGRSGQLLDAMLASVGMSREEGVFIANVIKCRPPGNRNPKPEEIAACSPYLMRQIALLKPERILVLGRFAAQALLGTDATIGSLRGRLHTVKTDGREIPVVVSYHPAYLLRSPGEKARSWQDLRLAAGA